jgi:hypothetical protein
MTNLDAKITNFNTSVINTVDYLSATEKVDVVSTEDMIRFLRENLTTCVEECLGYSMNIPDCFIVEKGKLEKTRIKNDFDPTTVQLIKYADFSTWLRIEIGFYIDDNTDKVVVGRDRMIYSLTIPIKVKDENIEYHLIVRKFTKGSIDNSYSEYILNNLEDAVKKIASTLVNRVD